MNQLLMGLLFFGSISAFAGELPKVCTHLQTKKSFIEHKVHDGKKMEIVHLFGNSARDIYSDVAGDETWITEKGEEIVIKSEKNMDCFRQNRENNKEACAIYECEILYSQARLKN